MNQRQTAKQLQAFSDELLNKIAPVYGPKGHVYGDERFQRWRDRLSSYLDKTLPGESERLAQRLGSYRWSDLRYQQTNPQKWFWGRYGEQAVAFLDGLVDELKQCKYVVKNVEETTYPIASKVSTKGRAKVFVVHGHDEAMKQSVARTLMKLKLEPIILHEQPDSGKTIIEKFERDSDVGFAVILLSPDDMGYKKDDGAKKAKPRARQNVIFELGYFVGKLGRNKVMALKRGDDLEVPSDLSGVVYTPFDDHGAWRLKLVKELKAAGYNADANDLSP